MAAKRKRRKSILLRLLVLGVSVYMVATLVGLWNTLNTKEKQFASLQGQLDKEQNEVDNLKLLLSDGSTAQIIEKAARERLGYVYSNEEVYIDISGN